MELLLLLRFTRLSVMGSDSSAIGYFTITRTSVLGYITSGGDLDAAKLQTNIYRIHHLC